MVTPMFRLGTTSYVVPDDLVANALGGGHPWKKDK